MRLIDADWIKVAEELPPKIMDVLITILHPDGEKEVTAGWNDALDAASTQAPPSTPRQPCKAGRCPYCDATNNDFIPINQTVEYSGIEMSLNRQGLLRVRYYHDGNSEFLTQDIIEIKHYPSCGALMED